MNLPLLRMCVVAAVLALGAWTAALARAQLNLQFVNDTGLDPSQVFITVQNRTTGVTDTNITYAGGTKLAFGTTDGVTNIMSDSVSLQTIGADGMSVVYLDGGIVFVSYGAALTATNHVPSFIGPTGPDYHTPFQPFELQYANVLYGASNNEVYSIPYSDRLGSGPLVDSVKHGNSSVDTWVVTLGTPVPPTKPTN